MSARPGNVHENVVPVMYRICFESRYACLTLGVCFGDKVGILLHVGSIERDRWKLSFRMNGDSVNSLPSGFPGLER